MNKRAVIVKTKYLFDSLFMFYWKCKNKIMKVNPPLKIYQKKGKILLVKKSREAAIKLLKQFNRLYPESLTIHYELARLYCLEKKWELAIHYWAIVFDHNIKELEPRDFIYYARALRSLKKYDLADDILDKGIAIFPLDNSNIHIEKAIVATRKKEWFLALEHYEYVLENSSREISVNLYIQISIAYRNAKNYSKAQELLEKGLDVYPNNSKLYMELSQLSILQRNWQEANRRSQKTFDLFKDNTPIEEKVKLAITYQLLGNVNKANEIYLSVFNDPLNEEYLNKKQYKKVVLFDNGESRIELYKQLKMNTSVCFTFDSINITWDQKPFGFSFLMKQDIDIVAVRKKRKKSYQQDLPYDDFYNSVKGIIKYYYKKIAYGFSLGGYSALYYGSRINCEILSLSPRNSAHPYYGDGLGVFEFTHDLSHPLNTMITPVIAYDPKNKIDRRYIEEELIKSYPNAKLMKFPYAGHRIAPFFLQVGILKEVVKKVIDGEQIPDYKKLPRHQSPQYLRILGNKCLRRNKAKWALKLGESATTLDPEDIMANRLNLRALITLGMKDEAILAAEKMRKSVLNDKILGPLFLDLYMEKGQMQTAVELASSLQEKFGHNYYEAKIEKIKEKNKVRV